MLPSGVRQAVRRPINRHRRPLIRQVLFMRRIRFSIGSLLVFILICGVAFAALKESTDWWEKGTFSVAVLVLLLSTLLSSVLAVGRRAFWLGFALFGWAYLLLSLIPSVETRLVTSQTFGYVFGKLKGQSQQSFTVTYSGISPVSPFPLNMTPTYTASVSPTVSPNLASPTPLTLGGNGLVFDTWSSGPYMQWNSPGSAVLQASGGSQENFVRVGHTAVALFLAWLGGMLARRISYVPVQAPIEGNQQVKGSEG